MKTNKIYPAIMGLVVGDALGVPVEFRKRDSFIITDMTGYGTYNQPPGTWSDDSSMTLATLESIGRLGRIDPADIMRNFFAWYAMGEFTPYGNVFDVGGATQKAIHRFEIDPTGSRIWGGKSVTDNGNGALMRILPVTLVPHTPDDIERVGGLTHAHYISQAACRIFDHLVGLLLNETPLKSAICALAYVEHAAYIEEFNRIRYIGGIPRKDIHSTGYVVDTLEAALWCLWNTNSYRECVLAAVNLGEDTDTTAAVAGGLAGIVYGLGGSCGIPAEWIERIPRRDWIENLCRAVQDGGAGSR